ncbi:MAG: hypothetical protein ACE366_09985 [Bradymonadia bacterium]
MRRFTIAAAAAALTLTGFTVTAQAEVPLATSASLFGGSSGFSGDVQSRRRYRRSRRRPRVTRRVEVVHSNAQIPGAGLIFGQIGTGTVGGAETYETPVALGAGFRYEAGNAGVEVGTRAVFADDIYGQNNLTSTNLRLIGQYHLNGNSMASPYFGAGLGLTHTSMEQDGLHYEGSGLSAEFAAGLSFLRDSPVRMNVEAAASLPFQRFNRNGSAFATDDQVYAPTFTLNVGLGFQVF